MEVMLTNKQVLERGKGKEVRMVFLSTGLVVFKCYTSSNVKQLHCYV